MRTVIVGLGLIGGSIAVDLRREHFGLPLVGVESNPNHARLALETGLVDEVLPLVDAVRDAQLVVLAIPVDAVRELAPLVLDAAGDSAVVIDTGSTKATVCAALATDPRRGQFVAAHPIAGTENSGPLAALAGLFRGKVNIICERERSSARALSVAESLFELLGMRTIFMDAAEHDLHLAYVSHLSHVSSFLLGQTVLDIEKSEENIFDLAGSGFASTVRLAKSSPSMWVPIFEQNAAHLVRALDEYIAHLGAFRRALAERDTDALYAITNRANDIRRVLDALGARANAGASPAPAIPLQSSTIDRIENHGGTQ
ncbi:MAG: prephenate dehydrogenase [Thermoanaerobaculia bacterium]|jgi:prephenate dehydrogenase